MTEHDFISSVSQNLVKYRKLNGLTQEELAECISYSNKSISKWERGESIPDAYVLFLLSEIYGITVSELIGQESMNKEAIKKAKEIEKDIKAKEKAKKRALERAKKHKKKG